MLRITGRVKTLPYDCCSTAFLHQFLKLFHLIQGIVEPVQLIVPGGGADHVGSRGGIVPARVQRGFQNFQGFAQPVQPGKALLCRGIGLGT